MNDSIPSRELKQEFIYHKLSYQKHNLEIDEM